MNSSDNFWKNLVIIVIFVVVLIFSLRTLIKNNKISNPIDVTTSVLVPIPASSLGSNPDACYYLQESYPDKNKTISSGGGYSSHNPLKELDINSFVDLGYKYPTTSCYGKDIKHVYYNNLIITDADPATFSVLSSGFSMSKDKNFVFVGNAKVVGADPKTIILIDQYIAKDKNHVFSLNNRTPPYDSLIIKDADPSSFQMLGDDDDFAKDDKNIFARFSCDLDDYEDICASPYGVVKGVDFNTFTNIGDGYAKDKNFVYMNKNSVTSSSDYTGEGMHLTKATGVDLDSFVYLDHGFFKDSSHVFFGFDLIKDADPSSFVIMGYDDYSKDNKHVFWRTSEIVGADPVTFTVGIDDNTSVHDKNHTYLQGRIDKTAY
jgi:hypothetical protein